MPLPLFALFIAAFAFGTTEFVIAGVLPQVAAGLDVTVPTAGYLVSAYALGIAVGGPFLTMATARLPRRTLLVSLTVAFTAGQAACALAPDFASMMAMRLLTSIAHGAYFGVAMVVAVGLVSERNRGMAIATVLAGLTVSGIIGVPAGAAIGNEFGWRATFWAMFGLGIVAVAVMMALLPRTAASAAAPTAFMDEVRVLGRQQVWSCLLLMIMLMICQYVPYTYIAPLLREVTGLGADTIQWVLLLCGIGATAGVFIGGRLSGDHLMPLLIGLFALQAVVMVALYLAAPYPIAMTAMLTLWSGINFAIGGPIQTRILTWAADAPHLASSLIPSGFNFGIALAASIGAILLSAGFPYRALPLLGVASMIVGMGVAIWSQAAERRDGARPPRPVAAHAG